MKKLFFVSIILSNFLLIAQNGVLTNAILLQREGSLEKALTEINKASEHEKTKGLAKTWYYKGLIYRDIYNSENSPAKTMVQDALLQSSEFLMKSIEIDGGKGEYSKLSREVLDQNYIDIINRGAAHFSTGKFQEANTMFKFAQVVKPTDTTAYTYGYSTAFKLEDKKEQKRNLDSLLKLQPTQHFALARSLNFALVEKDYSTALSLSQRALSSYPTDKDFQYGQFLSWMGLGKMEDAQNWLNEKLKASPYNIDYLLWQALLYKETKKQDQELLCYQKIKAMEPQHFTANYNAALIYVDRGNSFSKSGDKTNANLQFNKAKDHAKAAKALASEDELPIVQELLDNLEALK